MYGFLGQECPPEAPLREGECVCLDVNTHWDLSRQACVANSPSALTQRPTGSKRGGTGLFIAALVLVGVAYVAAQAATGAGFEEVVVRP